MSGLAEGIYIEGLIEGICESMGIDPVHAPDLEEAYYRKMYEGEEAGYEKGLKLARQEFFTVLWFSCAD